jgi:hypothetical protein
MRNGMWGCLRPAVWRLAGLIDVWGSLNESTGDAIMALELPTQKLTDFDRR